MCGILGIVTDPKHEPRLSQHDVLAMRDCMAARGLGGSSLVQRKNVVLAARSHLQNREAKPEQPCFSANDRFAILCDGHIFQLASLRDELGRIGFVCTSASVSEVLLNAWLAWGKSCVRKLHGAFAFVVVDLSEYRCWLVRDRCGAKPLYYAQIGHDFVFASSLKAIKRHPEFSTAPNFSTIRHYLSTLRLTLDNQTLFQNAFTTLPSEIVTFQEGRTVRDEYWTPDQPTLQIPNYRDAVDELEDQLKAAVGQTVDGGQRDGRFGVLLSGGIDSSLLGGLAANNLNQTIVSRCGGLGNEENLLEDRGSNFHFAHQFARDKKFDHRSVVVKDHEFIDTWRHLIGEFGSPLGTPNEVVQYRVARSLKNEVNVLLAADGADEVFCGYNVPHWAGRDFENSLTFSKVQSIEGDQTRESLRRQYGRDQFYSPSHHFLLTSGLMSRNTISSIIRPEHWPASDKERSLERYYDGLFDGLGDRPMVEKYAQVLFRINLESLLARLDRTTAQAGIQVRLPYTDHRLIEFAFRLPHHYKIDLAPTETQPWLSSMELDQRQTIRSKRILRSAAESWIPGDYVTRPKQSSSAAVRRHLATDWQPWISHTLRESQFFNELFHESTVDELVKLPESLAMWNWPILNLALWGDQVF